MLAHQTLARQTFIVYSYNSRECVTLIYCYQKQASKVYPACIYVTVFWKTDHLDTTEIHLLPVRDRHTHALSKNTKH